MKTQDALEEALALAHGRIEELKRENEALRAQIARMDETALSLTHETDEALRHRP